MVGFSPNVGVPRLVPATQEARHVAGDRATGDSEGPGGVTAIAREGDAGQASAGAEMGSGIAAAQTFPNTRGDGAPSGLNSWLPGGGGGGKNNDFSKTS